MFRISTPAMNKFFPSFFFLLFFPPVLFAQEELSVVLHVHSSVSSGSAGIVEIAREAKRKKIDAVIMTDLLCERYSYGFAPFQNFLKKTVSRKSVMDKGAAAYLKEIQIAGKNVPDVLMIDGAVVTPFYYWSGSLWPGPLVLYDRGKDLIVFGLSSAADYENIPMLQTGKSRFDAYHGEQGAAPFQDVIDYARAKKGFTIWSHPGAEERRGIKMFLGRQVLLNSKNSFREVAETEGYQAIGIYSVELGMVIDSPEHETAASAGGVWDRVLAQYINGRRKEPVWAAGEVDFNGMEGGNRDLGAIVNKVWVPSKSRENIFASLRSGNFYVITPGLQEMVLNSFTVSDPLSNEAAGMGGTAVVASAPKIKGEISFAEQARLPYKLAIVRNGKIIEMLDLPEGGAFEFDDSSLGPEEPAFYRIIAYADGGARLLSNPIFVRRSR